MRTLCPQCGTITNHRWSPLPPLCPTCKKRLPLRLPRQAVYLTRSFWRPVLIVTMLVILIGASPYARPYRQAVRNTLFPSRATLSDFNIQPARYTQ